MKPQRQHHADARPTREAARAALTGVLTIRPSLDGLRLESLARSYNIPPAEIAAMIAAEQARRAAR